MPNSLSPASRRPARGPADSGERRRALRGRRLLSALALFALVGAQIRLAGANQWEPSIQAFEAADAISFPAPSGNLFVGSSTIRLWTLKDSGRELATDMAPAPVIQRGFGGANISDVLYYIDRLVKPYQAQRLFLLAGGNDLENLRPVADVVNDFKSIVQRVRATSLMTQINFLSIKPSPAKMGVVNQIKEANQLIRDYCVANQVTYIDVFNPMFNADGTINASLYGSDGTHLSVAGYTVWTGIIRPYLAPNTLPVIVAPSNQTAAANGAMWSLPVTIGDAESALADLTVTATSSNTGLLPNANITFGGSGGHRTVTLTPVAQASGSATVTLTVHDGNGTTASASFSATWTASTTSIVTITSAKPASIATLEDQAGNALVSAIDSQGAALTWSVRSSASKGSAAVGASGASTTVTYTPWANANGSDSFVIAATDALGASATVTVNVTITPVNDAPSFARGADQIVSQNAGAQSVANWATAISAGPSDEASQALSFAVTGDTNPALFATAPAIAANGTLSYAPAANATGTATIMVQLSDAGGTANGGRATSTAQSFAITVGAAAARGPFGGIARPVPGTIQAEDFDNGGEGVAYHDTDAANNGGGYRGTGVDIRTTKSAPGWQVGWFVPGEWLEYTVSVASSGAYDLSCHLASGAPSGAIHVSVDGANASGTMTYAGTSSADVFTDIVKNGIALSAGQHVLRVTCDAGGLDLDFISFKASTTGASTRTLLVDLGASGMTTPGAWNNITELARSLGSSIDSSGAATGISIATNGFGWPSNIAVSDATLFPASAQGDFMSVGAGATGTVTFAGLPTSATYDVQIFASRQYANAVAAYTIGGVTKTLNAYNNTSATAQFTGMTTANGTLTITVQPAAGSSEACIGVIKLIQVAPALPTGNG